VCVCVCVCVLPLPEPAVILGCLTGRGLTSSAKSLGKYQQIHLMVPPHLFLEQAEEREGERERERHPPGVTKWLRALCAAVSPTQGGAGVWVNTDCIEIHRRPWSATSCSSQSPLTSRKRPVCLCCSYKASCGDSTIWFGVYTRGSACMLCACVC